MTGLGSADDVRSVAHRLTAHGLSLSEAGRAVGTSVPGSWSGVASVAATADQIRLEAQFDRAGDALLTAGRRLQHHATTLVEAQLAVRRSELLRAEGAALTRRWAGAAHDGRAIGDDPGLELRRRAAALDTEAQAMVDEAGRAAASVLDGAGHVLEAVSRGMRIMPTSGPPRIDRFMIGWPDPGDIWDGITGTIARGRDWLSDRIDDLRVVGEWTFEKAQAVGEAILEEAGAASRTVFEELRMEFEQRRAQLDFARYLAVGGSPAALPSMSGDRRRTVNAWSYTLVPLIEEAGGECAVLNNDLVACWSDGVELGPVGVPFNGRGGTTYGEVFVTDDRDRFETLVAGGNPGLATHEQAHSVQWALWGPEEFIAAYLLDAAAAGNDGTEQYFERQAGLADGGYSP